MKDGVIRYEGHELMVQPEDSKLVGKHNLYNIGVAYAICHLYGVSDEQFMGLSRPMNRPIAFKMWALMTVSPFTTILSLPLGRRPFKG